MMLSPSASSTDSTKPKALHHISDYFKDVIKETAFVDGKPAGRQVLSVFLINTQN